MKYLITLFFLSLTYFSVGQGQHNDDIDTLIISCPRNYYENVREEILFFLDKWENIPNPVVVVYKGTKYKEYFQINFKSLDGKKLNFAQGDNSFGDYKLFDGKGEDKKTNKEYLNKQFKIHWEWKQSSYPCCHGDYQMIKAYQPSIIKMELVE